MEINDLECGRAGEHLVCADLILSGYRAFLANEGNPYDVLCDIEGRFIRIQVKTTRRVLSTSQRNNAYFFNLMRRGSKGSKLGKEAYNIDNVDIMAFVILDVRKIGYIHISEAKKMLVLRPEEGKGSIRKDPRGTTISQYTLERAMNIAMGTTYETKIGYKKETKNRMITSCDENGLLVVSYDNGQENHDGV